MTHAIIQVQEPKFNTQAKMPMEIESIVRQLKKSFGKAKTKEAGQAKDYQKCWSNDMFRIYTQAFMALSSYMDKPVS